MLVCVYVWVTEHDSVSWTQSRDTKGRLTRLGQCDLQLTTAMTWSGDKWKSIQDSRETENMCPSHHNSESGGKDMEERLRLIQRLRYKKGSMHTLYSQIKAVFKKNNDWEIKPILHFKVSLFSAHFVTAPQVSSRHKVPFGIEQRV